MTSPTGDLATDVGAQLAAHREATGTSRRALAARIGVADTTLLEVERGAANPTLRRLAELAAGYGLTVNITLTPSPTKDPNR